MNQWWNPDEERRADKKRRVVTPSAEAPEPRPGADPSREYMRKQVSLRPHNFKELSAQEQWDIDKKLGILDWDGQ